MDVADGGEGARRAFQKCCKPRQPVESKRGDALMQRKCVPLFPPYCAPAIVENDSAIGRSGLRPLTECDSAMADSYARAPPKAVCGQMFAEREAWPVFKCGMNEVTITPRLGSEIPGSTSDRLSSGIKDELYAKALAMEAEGMAWAIVALDAIDVPRSLVERLRERVREATGMPAEHVMVTSTHTHTGGPTIRTSYVNAVDESYLAWLADKAADAVTIAYRGRREARIGFGRGAEPDIAFNRRFRMKDGSVRMNPGIGNPDIVEPVGPIDPDVLVMRIDDADGQPIGVVSNYACHACVVGGLEYSADYPGELGRALKRMLGERTVSLFVQGASGDINHIDVSGRLDTTNKDHYRTMGRILAGEAFKVRAKTDTSGQLRPLVRSVYVPVRFRTPTDEQIADAHRLLQAPEGEAPATEIKLARQILELAQKGEERAEAEIQAIALGDAAIVGLPAELFVEFGLAIKRDSPFPLTIVSQLSNGSVSGYVCTREAFRQGGYETRLRPYSRLAEETGERLVEHALKLLRELRVAQAEG